jgi:hypothetical protein
MTSDLPPYLRDIPVKLLTSAFRAGQELAWPRRDAIKVINWLSHHSRAVAGIEVWLPSTSGPEIPFPGVYTWALEPSTPVKESWPDFSARANHDAVAYVENFEWDENDSAYHGREPIFNLDVIDGSGGW